MATQYQFLIDPRTQKESTANIRRILDTDGADDFTSIPIDATNKDYQEYLEWLNAGNTPLPPA